MSTDLFGNVHLGYAVIETNKLDDWKRFGRDAVGMHCDDLAPDAIRFRLDANECRILLRRGPAEDVVALGWHLDDHATFDEICRRVVDHGVPAVEGADEEATLRGVERFLRFPGPNGLPQEIYTTARTGPLPLEIPAADSSPAQADSVTSRSPRRSPTKSAATYNHVFDARLSDYIDETINGMKLKIRFLRVNERHHSLAIASVNALPINPIRTRVQHVNVQVATLDDMVASYQRVEKLGFDMALSVGQHTNDKELSYYALTPRASNGRSAGTRSSSTNPLGNPPLTRASASGVTSPKGKPSSTNSTNSPSGRDRWCIAKTPWRRSCTRDRRSAGPPLPI